MADYKAIRLSHSPIAFLFVVLPFAAVLVQCLRSIMYVNREFERYVLIAMLSIYLGLINLTKVPISDLLDYQRVFYSVKVLSLSQFLALEGKSDWLFYGGTYYIYHIVQGSFALYVLVLSMVMYLPLLFAVNRLCRSVELNEHLTTLVLVWCAFAPDYFIFSAHLVRQTIAFGLASFFVVSLFTRDKYSWGYALAAITTHSGIAVVILLAILVRIQTIVVRSEVRQLFTFSTASVIVLLVGTQLINDSLLFLQSTFIADRYSGGFVDESNVDPYVWDIKRILLYLFAGLSLWMIRGGGVKRRIGMLYIAYFIFMLLLYGLGPEFNVLIYRYQIMVMGFVILCAPVVLCLLVSIGGGAELWSFVAAGFTVLVLYRFFVVLQAGSFEYASTLSLLINPWLQYVI